METLCRFHLFVLHFFKKSVFFIFVSELRTWIFCLNHNANCNTNFTKFCCSYKIRLEDLVNRNVQQTVELKHWKKMGEEYSEESDWLEIECDVWRTKFLASR